MTSSDIKWSNSMTVDDTRRCPVPPERLAALLKTNTAHFTNKTKLTPAAFAKRRGAEGAAESGGDMLQRVLEVHHPHLQCFLNLPVYSEVCS